jgi:IS4 transposase
MRLPDGEYVIVVSDSQSEEVMAQYKKRWKIEVLFEALKSICPSRKWEDPKAISGILSLV